MKEAFQNSGELGAGYYPREGYFLGNEEQRLPLFTVFFVAPLIVSSVSVAALYGFNYLVICFGIVSSVAYLVANIRQGFRIPKEIILFVLFILWSSSGFFIADYLRFYLEEYFTLIKFLVLILIITHYARSRSSAEVMLTALFLGGVIVAGSAYFTGQYNRAQAVNDRIAGTTLNANSFALTLVYCSLVLLYFFRAWKSVILKAGIISILLILAKLIIASGSRKGFIGFLLVLFLWFFFSYRKEIFRRPLIAIMAALAIILVGGFTVTRLTDTFLEQRFQESLEAGKGSLIGLSDVRMDMIREGKKIIASNPLFGVGLKHYSIASNMQTYSHNNYIELLCNAGIPGAVLYYWIFVVLWLRLRRLSKLPLENRELNFINIAKVFLILRLALDIVVVSYYLKRNWIMLSILIGFTYQLEQYAYHRFDSVFQQNN
jgi:O-antigen ligase